MTWQWSTLHYGTLTTKPNYLFGVSQITAVHTESLVDGGDNSLHYGTVPSVLRDGSPHYGTVPAVLKNGSPSYGTVPRG